MPLARIVAVIGRPCIGWQLLESRRIEQLREKTDRQQYEENGERFSEVIHFNHRGAAPPCGERGKVNAKNVSTAAANRYWRPSSSYVIGAFVMNWSTLACHRVLPVDGAMARKLPVESPPNSTSPAVVSRPEMRLPGPLLPS